MKIFHVEDDTLWREDITDHLKELGHTVVSCSMMTEAVEILSKSRDDFDVFICDGSIDKQDDGRKLAKELFNEGRKVVVISLSWENDLSGIPSINKGEFEYQKLDDILNGFSK